MEDKSKISLRNVTIYVKNCDSVTMEFMFVIFRLFFRRTYVVRPPRMAALQISITTLVKQLDCFTVLSVFGHGGIKTVNQGHPDLSGNSEREREIPDLG